MAAATDNGMSAVFQGGEIFPARSVFADLFRDLEDGQDHLHEHPRGEDVKHKGHRACDHGEEAIKPIYTKAAEHPANGRESRRDEAQRIQDADEVRCDEALEREIKHQIHDRP